jgi:hypothetical protein
MAQHHLSHQRQLKSLAGGRKIDGMRILFNVFLKQYAICMSQNNYLHSQKQDIKSNWQRNKKKCINFILARKKDTRKISRTLNLVKLPAEFEDMAILFFDNLFVQLEEAS